MTRKKVWRYYCDFCKKSGCSGGHLRRHEENCTANPERGCRMCEEPIDVAEGIRQLGKGDKAGVLALWLFAQSYPACMLAAVRQSGFHNPGGDEEGRGHSVPFSYKEAKEEWWSDYNAALLESEV